MAEFKIKSMKFIGREIHMDREINNNYNNKPDRDNHHIRRSPDRPIHYND
ncbi:hypothetical protein SESBI_01930 [Sesbania bispinosa]|nr:hypothetical protein SESBI_01930 [Sesbania bispinosa]